MSIDGLMPPNLVNMTAMIRDFSAYEVFVQHTGFQLETGDAESYAGGLEKSGKRLGEHSSLTTVILAADAWGPNVRKLDHRYSQEFDLVEVSNSIGESSLCRNRNERVRGGQRTESIFGTYYATLFRFRIRSAGEGTLALLWKKESGQCRIQSY